MGRKHSKRRKYSKRRNTKRRNTLRKLVKRRNTKRINTKRINTKRINTKRINTNNRVKNKNKFINGYKIIKSLNPHKKSVKYGGSCDEVSGDFSCKKVLGKGTYGSVYLVEKVALPGVEYAMKVFDDLDEYEYELNMN